MLHCPAVPSPWPKPGPEIVGCQVGASPAISHSQDSWDAEHQQQNLLGLMGGQQQHPPNLTASTYPHPADWLWKATAAQGVVPVGNGRAEDLAFWLGQPSLGRHHGAL